MTTDEQYARLLTFRTRLREFDRWSRDEAAARGLTHTQHQLLLVVRGCGEPAGPTIGQVAAYLLVRHHTAGELADRVTELGFTDRVRDEADHRVVRLRLTPRGQEVVHDLAEVHLAELRRLASVLGDL
ncbi:MAG: MarR family winged helix-turn-helix transcriptional regulator [Nostocoides sp.]